jgi:sulfur carrier protein
MSCRIFVNGRAVDTEAATLAELLVAQGHDLASAMACAINRGFVPRGQWAGRVLAEGDCVDVIVPVTGG